MNELDAQVIRELIEERDAANRRADRAETLLYGQPLSARFDEMREKRFEEQRLRELQRTMEKGRPL